MPKRETTDGLLAKFDNVVIEYTPRIAQADLAFCERMQREYENCVNKLGNWTEGLSNLKNELGNPEFIYVDTYGRTNEKRVSENWQTKKECIDKNPFSIFEFSADYGLVQIEKFISLAEERLIDEVTDYFNKEYNLKISIGKNFFRNEDGSYRKKVSYKEVVNYILDECGGIDIADIGVENLKADFRNKIYWRNYIKVAPQKLTIEGFVWYDKGYNGTYRLDYRFMEEKGKILKQALSFFETEELIDICTLPIYDREVDFSTAYEFPNFSKVESLKFFKNGKIELKFYDKGVAQEFYDFFEFDKIEKTR